MSISRREAQRLRKRIAELEAREQNRLSRWSQEWFGGVEIARAEWGAADKVPVATRTARALKHAVVVVGDETGLVRFLALPLKGDQ